MARSPLIHLLAPWALASLVALTACEGERSTPRSEERAPAPTAAAPPTVEDEFSGLWRVKGLTVDKRTGDTRVLQGTLVLAETTEGVYRATSDLTTEFPSPGGPIHADVIGKGDGKREGRKLSGKAETQLVMGTVPGVDTQFAFIPRVVGPRIVSAWTAEFDQEGALVFEAQNAPAPGEEYTPTTTTLRGERIEEIERSEP